MFIFCTISPLQCKEGFHPALSFTKKYQRWTRKVHTSSIMYQTSRGSTGWQRHKAQTVNGSWLWNNCFMTRFRGRCSAISWVLMSFAKFWCCHGWDTHTLHIVQLTLGGWLRSSRQCCSAKLPPRSQTSQVDSDIGSRHFTVSWSKALKQPKHQSLNKLQQLNQNQSPLQLPTGPAIRLSLVPHAESPNPVTGASFSIGWARLHHHPIPVSPICVNSIFAIHKCCAKLLEFQTRWKNVTSSDLLVTVCFPCLSCRSRRW